MDHAQVHQDDLNPHLRYYIKAAEQLGVGYRIFSQGSALFRFPGKESFYIMTSSTPLNPGSSNLVLKYKHIVYEILKQKDLSQPLTVWTDDIMEARKCLSEFKDPFVVKPTAGLGGRDVFIGVETSEELETAFNKIQDRYQAAKQDPEKKLVVLMQRFIPGENFRALVLGKEKIISVINRRPAMVKGNGKDTVRKLIDKQNEVRTSQVPKLPPIKVDDEALKTLKENGHSLDYVPKDGEEVQVNKVANLSKGGTVVNVPVEKLNKEIQEELIEAAKLLDLGLAAVDFITTDITKPFDETAGGINEVNCKPGLRNHYFAEGNDTDVALEIMQEIIKGRKKISDPAFGGADDTEVGWS